MASHMCVVKLTHNVICRLEIIDDVPTITQEAFDELTSKEVWLDLSQETAFPRGIRLLDSPVAHYNGASLRQAAQEHHSKERFTALCERVRKVYALAISDPNLQVPEITKGRFGLNLLTGEPMACWVGHRIADEYCLVAEQWAYLTEEEATAAREALVCAIQQKYGGS